MFNAYMYDSVVLIRKVTGTVWGENTTTRTTVKGCVEGKSVLMRNAAGEQVMVSLSVIVLPTTLTVTDKIEVDGVARSIVSIKKLRSFSVVNGLEVYLV